MKIKTFKFILTILVVLTALISCNKDDDNNTPTFVEADRGEQQAKDNDSILDYLDTHYYNSDFFETGTNHKYTDIVITKLEDNETVPVGHTLLREAVGDPLSINYFDVDYEYYVLRLNDGGGESPKFCDAVRVRYEGRSVESDEIFDVVSSPIDLPLVGNGFTTFGTIKAWQLILSTFNTSEDGFGFDDGVVNFENFGLGVMFVPSGLAYFSQGNTGTSYDNLIFKFELLQYEELDHDNDGVPSYVEDLDGDLDASNDDTDENSLPNYVDGDDDGDGVPTINELVQTVYTVDTNVGEDEPMLAENEYELNRTTSSGVITITTVKALDTNSNDILDYLDDTVTTDYSDEEN